MKILFLGYPKCKLLSSLRLHYDVTQTMDKIDLELAQQFDRIISFGYSHIIKSDIIDNIKLPIINLHISYLPYNRGYHPNFWSFLENTPKGITIHNIDKGIDTGDILLQKEVKFTTQTTLKETYDYLLDEIQNMFIENLFLLINNNITPRKQPNKGTIHYKKDLNTYKYLLTDGWDTKIINIMNTKKKRTDLEIIDEVEQIRTKNNVNWMDILRLAFKHAPDDARKLMGRVNEYDSRISELLKELSSNG